MNQEVPIPSLRQFLLPAQVLSVKLFEAATLEELETAVNSWVGQTKNIVAVCGPIYRVDPSSPLSLCVTFVPATGQ